MSKIKYPSSILVVDDNKPNRELMATLVKRMGHQATAAANGREALELLQTQPFDLVLLDIMMPEVDGYEVLEVMRNEHILHHTPVVVVSALSEIDSVVKCLELGAEDYLYKPINRSLLQARIESCLEKKHLREQEIQFLQEINSTKDQFVHTVSHELKNPIALIMGYVDIMLEGERVPDETTSEYLHKIRHYAQQMQTLIQDLLDLGRIRRGMPLSLAPVSIQTLVAKCIEDFKLPAAQKNITFHLTAASGSLMIYADAARIEQVLNNLLSNAIKYTPNNGHVEVTIERAGDHVVISVIDDGLGIPQNDLPRVFDTFFRVEREEHLEIEGTGLGLAIAKAIVEQHNGNLWVESELGNGSNFSLALPIYQPT